MTEYRYKKYTEGQPTAKPTRYEACNPSFDIKRATCSVEVTLAVIGGKWKVPILYHLRMEGRPLRFAELKKAMPSVTHRMLARQLRELEADGVIFRNVYPVVPPRVEYGMTERGNTLGPILEAMCKWGRANGWKEEDGKHHVVKKVNVDEEVGVS